MQIVCQDCGEDIALVHPQEVKERIASGQYVKGFRMVRKTKPDGEEYETSEKGIFGICKNCARLAATAPDLSDGSKAQSKRIRESVAEARRTMPAITLANAVKLAIEDEFAPRNEPNLAFRAYLLERAHLDPAERSLWRKVRGLLREVFGPHAGGVA
jgi:hypothetical protein